MNTDVQAFAAPAPKLPAPETRAIVARLRRWVHRLAGAWRQVRAHDGLDALDDATLRDLGLGRSEFSSYSAESSGRVETTRQRVARLTEPV